MWQLYKEDEVGGVPDGAIYRLKTLLMKCTISNMQNPLDFGGSDELLRSRGDGSIVESCQATEKSVNRQFMAEAGSGTRRKVRWLQRAPPAGDLFQAAVSGDQEWLSFSLRRTLSPSQPNKQGLTVLHVAAQHGRLDCVKLLVEAYYVDVNASCPCGRRPLHMVLSPQSKPHSHTCLTYLLQHGAQHNVSTDEGLTPLHMAAAEGLKNCVETLVEVGADTHAIDKHGHTPLDLARLWGHRVIARFLKNSMWQRDKKKEMEERKALQTLRHNLMWLYRTAESKEKVAREAVNVQKVTEWAEKKGLPLLWPPLRSSGALNHSCFPSTEPPITKSKKKFKESSPTPMWDISPNPCRPPPASVSRPQEVRMGVHPEKAPLEPDLRNRVTLSCFEDGRIHYTASWENIPKSVPALPMDVIQRGLFPSAFPSRITSPLPFQTSSMLDLPHRGCTAKPGDSPWTEVAMHLAEELELGHY
ncbi:ankyrin repeat domain-containing protein 53 isoform X1 [Astyanax mexicanus]|uniref:Ankyrin repeat domain-containing protein 53 isoform X1 n=2 Tax=Astyanax mexicanus TaxID=7994 RepID=A0A8T2LQQ2_ASTMX|nr:ankyrin repeat domain-containing protein 53 isoform X1 [Astyanax mexicanus]